MNVAPSVYYSVQQAMVSFDVPLSHSSLKTRLSFQHLMLCYTYMSICYSNSPYS